MLHEFLTQNRATLIERCRLKSTQRLPSRTVARATAFGIPVFLEQIIKTLQVEQTSEPMLSRLVSGPSDGTGSSGSEIGTTARRHGHELLQHGYSVERVVHDYGDLCQAITDLAVADEVPIQVDEFRTLNRCLDNAIADAVTEFVSERDLVVSDRGAGEFHEAMGIFAHEVRDFISTATLAVAALRTGQVGLSGPTGSMLDRSLSGLRNLVDRSLADVRLGATVPCGGKLLSLNDFISDARLASILEADSRGCVFSVARIDPSLAIDADREMLLGALRNLLRNAFKFTKYRTSVSLKAYAAADRIKIDVEDCCGGLPAGANELLFKPFTQASDDKSGVGLGLTICRRNIEANGGTLSVRDLPGVGCVFTIDLPRHLVTEKFFRV